MRLRRAHADAVDRQQILRAGGEGDDAVDLGPKEHPAARGLTGGRTSTRLPSTTGIFMKRFSGEGVSGGVSPSAASAAARLSVQLS